MADKGEKKQSPHYIPELDPENEASPPDTGVLVYLILMLLPFSTIGTFLGARSENFELLFLGLASSGATIFALALILFIKRKRDS